MKSAEMVSNEYVVVKVSSLSPTEFEDTMTVEE